MSLEIDIATLQKKVRRIEIVSNRLVTQRVAGEYHSVFKGQGIEFEEVRPYIFGDDIRSIDWNVTARAGVPHIKRFREEREMTVFFVVAMGAVAIADVVTPDADILQVGNQATMNLGNVAPAAVLTPQVSFQLVCKGNNHVDQGQVVTVGFHSGGSTWPPGGALSARWNWPRGSNIPTSPASTTAASTTA